MKVIVSGSPITLFNIQYIFSLDKLTLGIMKLMSQTNYSVQAA